MAEGTATGAVGFRMVGRRRFTVSRIAHAPARLAYRESLSEPRTCSDDAFHAVLGCDLFGPDWQPLAQVQDTLELCRVFGTGDRDWTVPAPLTTPGLVEAPKKRPDGTQRTALPAGPACPSPRHRHASSRCHDTRRGQFARALHNGSAINGRELTTHYWRAELQ